LTSPLVHRLKYRVLRERLAVLRLASDVPIPRWAMQSDFYSVARAPDELSIVCRESACIPERLPQGALAERGWLALRLEGPFVFSTTGVLASFVEPLADAHIPIFAISTFNTDYVLVRREDVERAVTALARAGHEKLGE
jgi:uncharacterized protein